jgi:hypothetical protein
MILNIVSGKRLRDR